MARMLHGCESGALHQTGSHLVRKKWATDVGDENRGSVLLNGSCHPTKESRGKDRHSSWRQNDRPTNERWGSEQRCLNEDSPGISNTLGRPMCLSLHPVTPRRFTEKSICGRMKTESMEMLRSYDKKTTCGVVPAASASHSRFEATGYAVTPTALLNNYAVRQQTPQHSQVVTGSAEDILLERRVSQGQRIAPKALRPAPFPFANWSINNQIIRHVSFSSRRDSKSSYRVPQLHRQPTEYTKQASAYRCRLRTFSWEAKNKGSVGEHKRECVIRLPWMLGVRQRNKFNPNLDLAGGKSDARGVISRKQMNNKSRDIISGSRLHGETTVIQPDFKCFRGGHSQHRMKRKQGHQSINQMIRDEETGLSTAESDSSTNSADYRVCRDRECRRSNMGPFPRRIPENYCSLPGTSSPTYRRSRLGSSHDPEPAKTKTGGRFRRLMNRLSVIFHHDHHHHYHSYQGIAGDRVKNVTYSSRKKRSHPSIPGYMGKILQHGANMDHCEQTAKPKRLPPWKTSNRKNHGHIYSFLRDVMRQIWHYKKVDGPKKRPRNLTSLVPPTRKPAWLGRCRRSVTLARKKKNRLSLTSTKSTRVKKAALTPAN